jgi:hypothetical protein
MATSTTKRKPVANMKAKRPAKFHGAQDVSRPVRYFPR